MLGVVLFISHAKADCCSRCSRDPCSGNERLYAPEGCCANSELLNATAADEAAAAAAAAVADAVAIRAGDELDPLTALVGPCPVAATAALAAANAAYACIAANRCGDCVGAA